MVLQTKSAVILLSFCCLITISCSDSTKNIPLVSVDVKIIPTVHSEDVLSLIYDSGIARYRLEAKIQDMYSNDKDPYMYYPEGIHVERFDSLFQTEGNISADTAYYFQKKDLWQVIGNVVVNNREGRTFETSELFWDVKVPANVVNAFYTNRLVTVKEPDGRITYYQNGFKADQSLTRIVLFSMKGEVYNEGSTESIKQNTISPDSIQIHE